MWLHQSSNCHTCKIPAASGKSAIEFVFGFCSTIQHQHENRKRWKLKQPEQNTLAAAALLIVQRLSSHEVFLQIKKISFSPPSGLCPFYLSSASARDQLSPWQTSPLLWLLCLLSAAIQAPCFDSAGPVGNKDIKTITDGKHLIFYWLYYIKVHVCPHTVAIFKLSRTCILSTSFSGTGSGLSRYANRPVGYKHRDEQAEMK